MGKSPLRDSVKHSRRPMTQARCTSHTFKAMSAGSGDRTWSLGYAECMRCCPTSWIWVVTLGCAAPAHVTVPIAKPPQCVALTPASALDVYGRVTDETGRPLEGVRIEEMFWFQSGPDWRRSPGATATTRSDGTYHLPLGVGHIVVFEREGRQVVAGHLFGSERIDIEIDLTKPRGVIAMLDARLVGNDRCDQWQCPMSHEPVADWWTRPHPCPEGAKLEFHLSGDYSMSAGVGVGCELDGMPHGAFTTWTLGADRALADTSGWFDHGKRCGLWREPPESPHPPEVEHPDHSAQ